MEHSLEKFKAKEISGYVKAKYGEQSLGLVRLLSSVPYFRQAVVRGKLPDLLGMSLISFEKYLREQHQILYRYDGSSFVIERLHGGGAMRIGTYQDDGLFSIGGAVVAKIRELHPDADALNGVPVVSLGRGRSIPDMLDDVDIQSVVEYVARLPDDYPIDSDALVAINDYGAMVEEGEEVEAVLKYKAVDALHKLYVQLRLDDPKVTEERELEPCKKEQFMDVVMGMHKASVVPPEGGVIPKVLLEALQEAHPTGEIREGGFYMKGEVVLDPFKYIKSARVEIELPDLEQQPPVVVAPKIATQPSISAQGTTQPGTVTAVDPSFDSAVNLVLRYFDTNINDLEPAEKEIALYGFSGGEAAFKKMSAAAQKSLTKAVGLGDHQPFEVIYKLATTIRSALRNRVKDLTHEQYALLAAGRIIAWKGNWLIEPEGIWRKEK